MLSDLLAGPSMTAKMPRTIYARGRVRSTTNRPQRQGSGRVDSVCDRPVRSSAMGTHPSPAMSRPDRMCPATPPVLFCSRTCRLIDLGVWLDARYRVPKEAEPDEQPSLSAVVRCFVRPRARSCARPAAASPMPMRRPAWSAAGGTRGCGALPARCAPLPPAQLRRCGIDRLRRPLRPEPDRRSPGSDPAGRILQSLPTQLGGATYARSHGGGALGGRAVVDAVHRHLPARQRAPHSFQRAVEPPAGAGGGGAVRPVATRGDLHGRRRRRASSPPICLRCTTCTVGASGSIFGLLGALVAYGQKPRRRLRRHCILRQYGQWALVLFVAGFLMSGRQQHRPRRGLRRRLRRRGSSWRHAERRAGDGARPAAGERRHRVTVTGFALALFAAFAH